MEAEDEFTRNLKWNVAKLFEAYLKSTVPDEPDVEPLVYLSPLENLAITNAKDRNIKWTPEELDQTAEAVEYGSLKYADLKNNRLKDYKFNADQMLNDNVNTAVYLLYAHARICSIIQKSGKDIDELKKTGKVMLHHADERALELQLIQFSETVEEACNNLLPNVLCKYLYSLSEYYNKFHSNPNCQVIGSEQETSRLLLCEATVIVMRKCFHLLGVTPVYKL
ncbi:arginine--tRNA ligase, chloroplastic/mitochondrial-like [Eutrema salsugineum]|uniref:arginine--tRNA ligase, chloroplastic/mitochondrial-like n=1 Tax=Eutrema salsugineum TaxID=72664 RepID=UPI000CED0C42|nr:arginine--tRNA ligase, chloroplastic/mitochondrial-like [Eutrema salsugineum]